MSTTTIDRIVDIVCRCCEIKKAVLLGRSRLAAICEARHIAMYMCRKYEKMSYQAIGNYFGRSHSVVIHDIRILLNLYDVDKQLRILVGDIVTEYLAVTQHSGTQ